MKYLSTNTLFVGKVAKYLPSVNSTNLYAKVLLSKSKPIEGTVIYTDEQRAGRGQIGSKWESEAKKNIILSLILYPNFLLASQQFQLNKAISLAIIDFLSDYISPDWLRIKWPNDIYIKNQKIGGILIENSLKGYQLQNTIVGIGLNINQEIFSKELPNPSSLKLATQQGDYDLNLLLGNLCQRLEQRYLQLKSNNKTLDKDYLAQLLGYQEWRNFALPQASQTALKGKITGVSPEGKLQLETLAHPLEFDLKEIKFLFKKK